jgi:hypothetical protein
MENEKLKNENVNIHIKAVIALMLIQLIHKIVREIPGSMAMEGPGSIIVIIFSILLLVGIILLIFKIKWGLLLGIIDAVWMIFQPILVHIILSKTDINNIWWYPVFPWIQSLLIIYFCILTWKKLT